MILILILVLATKAKVVGYCDENFVFSTLQSAGHTNAWEQISHALHMEAFGFATSVVAAETSCLQR